MGWPTLVYKGATLCLKSFCVYYTFTTQVVDLWLIDDGQSMEPTLSARDIVVAVPVRSLFWPAAPASLALLVTGRAEVAPVRRGDLVVARSPGQPGRHIVKRVRLLEKDRIPPEVRKGPAFVPPGRVWLEGDNSANSLDSRTYGCVPLGLVRARVVARLPAGAPLV